MAETIIPRKLWYLDTQNRVTEYLGSLTTDPRPLIVLGEAGMGKSTLLRQLGALEGYAFCTARRLVNTHDAPSLFGAAETLVIDAIDEVSASRAGDAVDRVLQKLDQLGCPRFILSCRVADWRSATALQGILEFYNPPPLELHLEPLDREDASAFLAMTLGVGKAEETIQHLVDRGLSGLWSNPQTLGFVEKLAASGDLPSSKGDLFDRAIGLLRNEHREDRSNTALTALPKDDILDAAGAAFATLIFTGAEALSRRANVDANDLAIREISGLPRAGAVEGILDCRLFSARSPDRFSYLHRAIGEFLGARWLARTADTARKRRRLIDLFESQTLVPASLRGLHGWLAWHSAELAIEVIASDPMSVIEYGDADRLTPEQGRVLLSALKSLSRDNPRFRDWTEYRVGGLMQVALLTDIKSTLADTNCEFGLRLLILQALESSPLIPEAADVLLTILLDFNPDFPDDFRFS